MSSRLSRLCHVDKFHITQTVVMVMMMISTAFVLKSTLIMMLTRILIFREEGTPQILIIAGKHFLPGYDLFIPT